jgi:hypothetical protein
LWSRQRITLHLAPESPFSDSNQSGNALAWEEGVGFKTLPHHRCGAALLAAIVSVLVYLLIVTWPWLIVFATGFGAGFKRR